MKIRKKILILSFVIILLITIGAKTYFAQNVKDTEVEGYKNIAWITTVYSRDFPKIKDNSKGQKEEFIEILDELKSIGISDVVVQVRPKGDALYKSEINPWSDVLTGVQGKNPGYDPLDFMIEEAHKRGMKFHAWLNPYRVTTSGTDLNKLSKDHYARLNPNLLIKHKIANGSEALCYNPALDEVKNHVRDTVLEIIENYDVDAIHFDDYFYPSNYPLPAGEDKDGKLANQRREDVNDMVRLVSKTIKEFDSSIEFGISPSGIWKNSQTDPKGSNTLGSESYYRVYSDSLNWIENEYIDYIVPQIYWERGHSHADYETLVKWWNDQVDNSDVELYIGQGIYKDQVASEILEQLEINSSYKNVKGSFYYSLRELMEDKKQVKKSIKEFYEMNKNKENDLNSNIEDETNTDKDQENPSIDKEMNIIFGDTSIFKR